MTKVRTAWYYIGDEGTRALIEKEARMKHYIAYAYYDEDEDYQDELEFTAENSKEAEKIAYNHFNDHKMVEICEIVD